MLLNESLQSCLNVANSRMSNSGLKPNASKTKCMLTHSPRTSISPPSLDIQLGDCRNEQVTCFKCLGVLVSDHDTLCWSNHINHITRKVPQCVNFLRWLSWFLPSSLLVLYLKSFILPCVDYCDGLGLLFQTRCQSPTDMVYFACCLTSSPPVLFFCLIE